ncbi:MAG TPA: 2-phospho-L-lactate guanylyltransferase [Ornithinimicrobium sp.]|nr:2-phospho-L-lactate guanylyltransferase [Ornithinimicrobium sp.]
MRTNSDGDPVRWRLVVPVKQGRHAKSRLTTSSPAARAELARAMALDTLQAAAAALGPASLTVVTSDGPVASVVRGWGADVLDDPGLGLDAAVRTGLTRARAASPGPPGWAVLLGDLPALRPRDLLDALAACAHHPDSVVPDASGDGTTLLTSTLRPPTPRFGPGSARRHAEAATLLALRLPRLRQDVDVLEDLTRAVALGVGRRTRAVLTGGVGVVDAYSDLMQASVHTFDLDSRSGSVLLDNGRRIPFDEDVFAASGLRHVRVGQRVSVQVEPADPEDPDAHLTRLWIVGIGRDEPIR